MPILDIELVQCDSDAPPVASLTQALAEAAGHALGSAAGRTWVRLHPLAALHYAENGVRVAADELPVFVTVLHATPPQGAAMAIEVGALTQALAACLGRSPQRIHLQYAPAGAGRQAFGGVPVR